MLPFQFYSISDSRKKMLKSINYNAMNMKSPVNEIYQYYTPYYEADKPYCTAIKNFTNINSFHPGHYEMVVRPCTTEIKSKVNHAKVERVDSNGRSAGNENQKDGETTSSSSGVYDMSTSSNVSYVNPQYCYSYAEPV